MTLSLDNPVQGGFDVDVFTDNGTALSGAGNDYTALSQTVSFAGTASENQTVIINVDNDTIAEGNEAFYLRMSNRSTSLPVSISDTATLTINDDDTTTVTNRRFFAGEQWDGFGNSNVGQGSSGWLHGGSLYRQRDSYNG